MSDKVLIRDASDVIDQNRRSGRGYWQAAWVVFLLSIPLRLTHFIGFGFADDVNDFHIANYMMENGGLDPTRSESYRLMTTVLRSLFFWLFGSNEVAFVLLPFLAVSGASIVLLFFARDLFGGRGAFFAAIFLFCSPFETLAATANLTDYVHGFFGVLAAWNVMLGFVRNDRRNMYLGAAALFGATLNKVSGLGLLPLAAAATVFSAKEWRRWIPFWQGVAILFLLLCCWDVWFSGKPLRWLLFNNFFEGYEVSGQLKEFLLIAPRDIVGRNIHNGRFFGFISWLSLAGAVVALFLWMVRRGGIPAAVIVLYCVGAFCIFNFMPHKLTLEGYYSHYRVWRYIGQIAPAIYLAAVFFVEIVNKNAERFGPRRLHGVGSLLGIGIALHALFIMPETVRPSLDANSDGRKLVQFFRTRAVSEGSVIYVDSVKAMWMSAVFYPDNLRYRVTPFVSVDREKTREFLLGLTSGVVVTGGSTLGWYGNVDMNFDLEWCEVTPPPNWKLLYQFDAPVAHWRREPLRVWRVDPLNQEAAS